MNMRKCVAAAFVLVALSVHAGAPTAERAATAQWKATWTASPHAMMQFDNGPPPAAIKDVTIRQLVHISAGGSKVRVRFSNEYGSKPLAIGAASVSAGTPAVIKPLSFGGASSIVVPAGAPALSDPVDLTVMAGQDIAISVYLPVETDAATVHMTGLQKAEMSRPGDFTQAAELPVAGSSEMRFFLSAVEVQNLRAGVIVAFGDSITDGMGSTVNANLRWPDLLAERLRTRKGNHAELAVVNQGISGNQLLKDGMGQSALARMDRDVLGVAGVSHVIVMIGINDIGWPGARIGDRLFDASASPGPTAENLIAGYKQLIARAQDRGLKIFGATLTPFAGASGGYYSSAKDAVRKAVNEWIRSKQGFDGVIDFDAVTRDPQHPEQLLPAYDSGDHLHPSSAGYKAMAQAVDLALFD